MDQHVWLRNDAGARLQSDPQGIRVSPPNKSVEGTASVKSAKSAKGVKKSVNEKPIATNHAKEPTKKGKKAATAASASSTVKPREKQARPAKKPPPKRVRALDAEAVRRSRAKRQAEQNNEYQKLEGLRSQNELLLFEARRRGFLSDCDRLQEFVSEDYPDDIRRRRHDPRPNRRPQAKTEEERISREREVNCVSSKRHELRVKWDEKERDREIAFLDHQNNIMKQALDANLFADCFAAQDELLSMCAPQSPVNMHAIVVSVGDLAMQASANGSWLNAS